MKQPTFNGRVLLPMDVIEAARAGDPLALERILRYYDRYINKICTRGRSMTKTVCRTSVLMST